MSPKKVVIEIDEKGNCSIDGQGFKGTECEKFIREIESVLGTRINVSKKAEYRQRAQTRQRERA